MHQVINIIIIAIVLIAIAIYGFVTIFKPSYESTKVTIPKMLLIQELEKFVKEFTEFKIDIPYEANVETVNVKVIGDKILIFENVTTRLMYGNSCSTWIRKWLCLENTGVIIDFTKLMKHGDRVRLFKILKTHGVIRVEKGSYVINPSFNGYVRIYVDNVEVLKMNKPIILELNTWT